MNSTNVHSPTKGESVFLVKAGNAGGSIESAKTQKLRWKNTFVLHAHQCFQCRNWEHRNKTHCTTNASNVRKRFLGLCWKKGLYPAVGVRFTSARTTFPHCNFDFSSSSTKYHRNCFHASMDKNVSGSDRSRETQALVAAFGD